MRDLSRWGKYTFNNGFPKAPRACCFLYCYWDRIRSPLGVANGIIITSCADRFLMNVHVTLRFNVAHSSHANHDYKRAGVMRLAHRILIDNKINAAMGHGS